MEEWKQGTCIVELRSLQSSFRSRFVLETRGSCIILSKLDRPLDRLSLQQNGNFCYRATNPSLFMPKVIDASRSAYVLLLVVKYKPSQCLDFTTDGEPLRVDESLGFQISIIDSKPKFSWLCSDINSYIHQKYALAEWQALRFYYEGYLHVPSSSSPLISTTVLLDCLRVLNHYLGIPGAIVPGGSQGGSVGKFCGEVTNRLEVKGLFISTGLKTFVERCFFGGDGMCDLDAIKAQVAFRFPELNSSWRVTGIDWHTDGLRQGKAHPFSLLVGVCLSDASEGDSGNLHVWSGSHRLIHTCVINEFGCIDSARLRKMVAELGGHGKTESGDCEDDFVAGLEEHITGTSASLTLLEDGVNEPDRNILEEMAAFTSKSQNQCVAPVNMSRVHDNEPSDLPDLGPSVQILAKAGDVVFLHPDTAHAGGHNHSCDIRKMVYFRLVRRTKKAKADPDPSVVENSSSCVNDIEEEMREDTRWQGHRRDMWVDLPGVIKALPRDIIRGATHSTGNLD